MLSSIQIDRDGVESFCRKWRLREFALFGSVLREDFGPGSDIDVLVEFEPDVPWSLYEWVDMIEEASALLGRKVDLVSKEGLRNPYRRREILATREVIHAQS